MRKQEKAGRSRHSYKLASSEGSDKKDTVLTLEVADGAKPSASTSSEFTDGAHLRQVLCLMPSDTQGQDKQAEDFSSDDSDDELNPLKKQGNLVPSKAIQAYIRVSKMHSELNAKPNSANIVRSVRKVKQIKKRQ